MVTNSAITGLAGPTDGTTINYAATGGSFGGGIIIHGSNTSNDVFNVQSTLTGGSTTIDTEGGDDTVNVSSDAPTHTGNLNGILGDLRINTMGNATATGDTLYISDYSSVGGRTYALTHPAGNLNATQIATSGGPAHITYDANGTAGQLEHLILVGSKAGGNIYNIPFTSATVSNAFTDGDATDPGSSVFNIQADQLLAGSSNAFTGNGGGNTFNLNYAANASTSTATGTTLVINGGAGSSASRNVVNVNVTADTAARSVGFTYPAATGDEVNMTGLGAATNATGPGVQVSNAQEVNFFGATGDADTATVTGRGAGPCSRSRPPRPTRPTSFWAARPKS